MGYNIYESTDQDAVAAYLFGNSIILRKKNSITFANSSSVYEISPGAKDVLYHDGYIFICFSDNIVSIKCS